MQELFQIFAFKYYCNYVNDVIYIILRNVSVFIGHKKVKSWYRKATRQSTGDGLRLDRL